MSLTVDQHILDSIDVSDQLHYRRGTESSRSVQSIKVGLQVHILVPEKSTMKTIR